MGVAFGTLIDFGVSMWKRGGVTKNVANGFSLAPQGRLSWFLLAVLAVAFLQPFHVSPFSTDVENIGLATAVLALAGVSIWWRGYFVISTLLWLWLGFAVVLLVSGLSVKRAFDSPLYAYWGVWAVGMALIQLGASWSWLRAPWVFGRDLAWFLFIISLISVVVGLVKFYGLCDWMSVYMPEQRSSRMQGVMNQSNFFAVLTLLGCLAALWLASVRQFSPWLVMFLLPLYCAGLILSGTRTVYLIYFAILPVAVIQSMRLKSYLFPVYLFLLAAVFAVMSVLFARWGVDFAFIGDRLDGSSAANPRWQEWALAWGILKESLPWGLGAGGYASASYQMHLRVGEPVISIWMHSHNSYLQIALEFGVLGIIWGLAMACLMGRVLWRSVGLGNPVPAAVLLSLLIYSLFEFPLWYMSFFVLGFLVLAAGVESREVRGGRVLGAGIAAIALSVGIYYGWLLGGYLRWHFDSVAASRGAEISVSDTYPLLDRLAQDPLLNPNALVSYYIDFGVNVRVLPVELNELSRLYRYLPFPVIGARYAITLGVAGRHERSLQVRDEMLAAFPDQLEYFRGRVAREMAALKGVDLSYLLEGLPQGSGLP